MSLVDEVRASGAKFSPDRIYRYLLWRVWSADPRRVLFICLNPSIADEVRDDPTQRRMRRFAKDWGFGGYYVGNLFAFVSTDPSELKKVSDLDLVGPDNDYYLKQVHSDSAMTITAWGTHGKLNGRDEVVMDMLEKIKPTLRFGTNSDGSPKHPLYLKANTKPVGNDNEVVQSGDIRHYIIKNEAGYR